jgi:hypothetical protein
MARSEILEHLERFNETICGQDCARARIDLDVIRKQPAIGLGQIGSPKPPAESQTFFPFRRMAECRRIAAECRRISPIVEPFGTETIVSVKDTSNPQPFQFIAEFYSAFQRETVKNASHMD